jgi:hypothetical protein
MHTIPANIIQVTHRTSLLSLAFGVLVCGALAGCAGYRMGTQSLYAPEIRSVYVPVFESDSFRRNLGEWLTEAVVKEIELKTPYKVVGNANADSILTGRLVSDTKHVLVEDAQDYPREIELNLVVQVQWIDRHGVQIRDLATIPLDPALVRIGQSATLAPQAGQSIASAQQKAIQRLAEQIVSTMEAPW